MNYPDDQSLERKQHRIDEQREEKEKEEEILNYRKLTQFNMVLLIKQIVCTFTGEGGDTLLNFEEVQ